MTEITEEKQNKPHLFQPGQSGNPNGRPKGSRSFTTKVKEALEKIAEGKDYTYEEAFIKAILKKAIVDQDTGMMKTVWEQLDGKPLQRSEITGKDGKELPTPIIQLNGILPDNSNQQDNSPQ
jgi:Family of unknown function (DUF5681)